MACNENFSYSLKSPSFYTFFIYNLESPPVLNRAVLIIYFPSLKSQEKGKSSYYFLKTEIPISIFKILNKPSPWLNAVTPPQKEKKFVRIFPPFFFFGTNDPVKQFGKSLVHKPMKFTSIRSPEKGMLYVYKLHPYTIPLNELNVSVLFGDQDQYISKLLLPK